MAEAQPSSRRSRQPRQPAIQAPHNSEVGEFSANQPANFVGSVHSIPVNPRLEMHSTSLFINLSTTDILVFFEAASLREREERAARKAAKKIEKARQTEAAKGQQTEAAAIQPQTVPSFPVKVSQTSKFYDQLHSSAAPLFSVPEFTNIPDSSPGAPVFQGSNLTLLPHNAGQWNQNQYAGTQSSPTPEPWNQHRGNQNLTGIHYLFTRSHL